ncbi:MAG: sugar phosphate isomerase/epimerase family protein [Chthoniobacterales bacterium]
MKYSIFSLTLPQYTPAEAAKVIKEAGYDGVEWRCLQQPDELPVVPNLWGSNRTTLDTRYWKKLVPEYRAIMNDNGLEFSNLATYCQASNTDDVKACIEIAKEIGSPRLRICGSWYRGAANYNELYKEARAQFTKVSELCKDAGVQGLLELHPGSITPSASLALRLLDGLDPKHIAVMYDPGNMAMEGYENWQLGCQLLGPYLAYCHIQNTRHRAIGGTPSGAVHWVREDCELHTGLVDWISVFKAFNAVGYDGWVSNETHQIPQGSSPDQIRDDLLHLKRCVELASAE